MRARLTRIAAALLPPLLLGAAAWALHAQLRGFHLRDVRHGLAALPGAALAAAAAITLLGPLSGLWPTGITGDGGWVEFDKGISGALADAGVAVVGLDSPRYLWKRRTPTCRARTTSTRTTPAWRGS